MVENNDLKGYSMNAAIIKLIETNMPESDWKVILPITYQDALLEGDGLHAEVAKELATSA